MAHRGHRDNPIIVAAPGDLDRATLRGWDPTPAQAAAGNYKMSHAVISGMHVAIETPKDRLRSGVGPDGTPWSVRMPAHYGYVKRSVGADGDAVDVYIGPRAHEATTLPVWIVDQCDADEKGFDEHKVMIGFPDSDSARNTYLAAFSDGRGHERIGAVSRTTFEHFKKWLDSDGTKIPITMKSAWATTQTVNYVSATCSCGCSKSAGPFGGSMPEAVVKTEAAAPGGLNKILGILGKGLSRLSPVEQGEVMAEAGLLAKGEMGKASEFLDSTMGDHGHIPMTEDQWSGPPDDKLMVRRAFGPSSRVPAGGGANTGPAQSASGDGAEKMEREYSRFATQEGVQRATEELGESIMGMGKAMRSILKGMEARDTQFELLKGSVAEIKVPSEETIKGLIDSAVAKAIGGVPAMVSKAVRSAIAKAEEDKKGDDDKKPEAFKAEGEDDDDADKSEKEAAKAENDHTDSEDDDKDEASKSFTAMVLRRQAWDRVKWCSRRLLQAEELVEAGKPKAAAIRSKMAIGNLQAAVARLETAKSINPDMADDGVAAVARQIAKAKKGIQANAENQDIWPSSSSTAKGADPVVVATTVKADGVPDGFTTETFKTAVAAISSAADGMGLLTTDVRKMFEVMGQSKNGGNGLPPVFTLAKANGDVLTAKSTEVGKLYENGTITIDDRDRAMDIIGQARMKMPEELLMAKTARLPDPIKAIFGTQIAA